jgi:hypothetical protein
MCDRRCIRMVTEDGFRGKHSGIWRLTMGLEGRAVYFLQWHVVPETDSGHSIPSQLAKQGLSLRYSASNVRRLLKRTAWARPGKH